KPFVDRPAQPVEHPAEQRPADRDGGRVTGRPDRGARPKAVEFTEWHADDAVAVQGDDLAADLAGGGEDDHGVADGGVEAGHLEVDADHAFHAPEPAGPGGLERRGQTAPFDDAGCRHRSVPSSAARTRSRAGPSWASMRESPTSRMQPPCSTDGSAMRVSAPGTAPTGASPNAA